MSASNILFGGLMIAGIVVVGAELNKPQERALPPTPAIAPDSPPIQAASNESSVAIQRAPDRHFYANALVNGTEIRFLIDTGSSSVVLTQADARRVGLGTGNYDRKAIGAGGEIRLMPVRLARLTIGPLVTEALPALVAEEGRLPVSLLGQTFLDGLESVAIQGDTMTLH